ncbi:MAG: hypothetical protein NXH72_04405 [Hyphomonadaceae bacterium]|nr:hypothetical protein [Hyphomonadaceae bacterium]
MRAIIIPALSAFILVACDQVSEIVSPEVETPPAETTETEPQAATPEAPERNVAERKTATIDWNAARADFAARDMDDGAMAQVASGGSPAVPILLPDEPVGVASAGGEDALQFRPLADGYFAVKKGEVYDMIINGTDRLVAQPGGSGAAIDTELDFEETMTGAQVSFSRYGASYLVEFMCKDPATAIKGSCITEADAVAEVEKLLIAGTR